jgi:hypothetical protein
MWAIWRIFQWIWGKIGGNALFQVVVDVGLWTWVTSVVFSAVAFVLAWINDLPAVMLYLVVLVAFSATVMAINGVQQIRERGQTKDQVLPQDDEKREEIEIFFKTYIRPLNKPVRYIEARLREHLRKSQTGKDRDLTVFFADYGKGIHGHATGRLENEFVIPENGGIGPLHRKLREFCNAYHGLVECINHLVQFSSYPLKEDPDYEKWRDKHKLFHLKLTELLGKEKDPSTLKRGLDVDWPDILR